MRHWCLVLLSAIGLMAAPCAASSEPVMLAVGDPLPRAELITPGVRRYLTYVVKDGAREAMAIWDRETRFDIVDGQEIIRITQRWDRVNPAAVRIQDSTFEARTFRPLDHLDRALIDGAETLRGYRFEPDRIVGIADLPGNARADFEQAADETPFNFETDLEQFQGLAWGPGYDVSIPFYDPGLAAPARYVFHTDGSELVAGPGGVSIDCWRVTGDYNTGAVRKTFWISKATQEVVREETVWEGDTYIKTLLTAESGGAGVRVRLQPDQSCGDQTCATAAPKDHS